MVNRFYVENRDLVRKLVLTVQKGGSYNLQSTVIIRSEPGERGVKGHAFPTQYETIHKNTNFGDLL